MEPFFESFLSEVILLLDVVFERCNLFKPCGAVSASFEATIDRMSNGDTSGIMHIDSKIVASFDMDVGLSTCPSNAVDLLFAFIS